MTQTDLTVLENTLYVGDFFEVVIQVIELVNLLNDKDLFLEETCDYTCKGYDFNKWKTAEKRKENRRHRTS